MYRGVLLPPADMGRLPEEGRERRDRFCAEYGRKRSIVLEEEMIESGNSVASESRVEFRDFDEATELARVDLLDEFLELVLEIFEQFDDLDDIELCSKALFKYGDSS